MVVKPSEIWLVEQPAATPLCRHARGAVSSADVVMYDRSLGPFVACHLPIGRYAEPLPPDGRAAAAISRRALEFAAAGWSIAQVVAAGSVWRQRLRTAPAEAAPINGSGDLPVRVITGPAGRTRHVCLPELASLVDELADGELLTLVLGPLALRFTAPSRAFTANGLAG